MQICPRCRQKIDLTVTNQLAKDVCDECKRKDQTKMNKSLSQPKFSFIGDSYD